MNQRLHRLWHIFVAAVGIGIVVSPDILGLSAWLTSLDIGWLTYVGKGLAAFGILVANFDKIRGKLQPIVDGAMQMQQVTSDASAFHPGRKPRPSSAGPVTVVLLSLALASAAWAQSSAPAPQLGTCFGPLVQIPDGTWQRAYCLNPAVLVPAVVRFDIRTSAFQIVPALGGCYGLSYHQWEWWSPGVDACVAVQFAKDLPNQVTPALLFKFMGIRAGADLRLTQQTGAPLDKGFGLLFTYGFDVGGSPAYVARASAGAK